MFEISKGGVIMGLKLENVTKIYAEKTAVDGLSLEMNKPGVYGLLGTNGARKDYYNKNDFRNYEKKFWRNNMEWTKSR